SSHTPTLSLHDALPIYLFDFITNTQAQEKILKDLAEHGEVSHLEVEVVDALGETKHCLLSLSRDTSSVDVVNVYGIIHNITSLRSEEHTSELQSRENLV